MTKKDFIKYIKTKFSTKSHQSVHYRIKNLSRVRGYELYQIHKDTGIPLSILCCDTKLKQYFLKQLNYKKTEVEYENQKNESFKAETRTL